MGAGALAGVLLDELDVPEPDDSELVDAELVEGLLDAVSEDPEVAAAGSLLEGLPRLSVR